VFYLLRAFLFSLSHDTLSHDADADAPKTPPNQSTRPPPSQIPTIGFLYVAGWIGYVGRNYIQAVKATKDKPTQAEIILDVPMALRMAFQGAAWPAAVVEELKSGTLTEKEENITVSPR